MADADAVGRASHSGGNPRTEIYLKFCGNVVSRSSFTTFGCGVSIACCSALTEMVKDRTFGECSKIEATELVHALDGVPLDKLYCASIAIAALRDALSKNAVHG